MNASYPTPLTMATSALATVAAFAVPGSNRCGSASGLDRIDVTFTAGPPIRAAKSP
jgi:hypothetical protein